MKQVILNFNNGELAVEEVPVPVVQAGGVLVRNHYSLISAGTETSALDLASKSLIGKARARPDLVKKVVEKAKKDGALTTFQQAMSRLDKPEPLGYSCAGEVIAVGEGVVDLAIGDLVACAGVGYASHAEVIYVPRNLCVRIPAPANARAGAFTTVGAIALQGLRIAETQIGERVAVIGLGLVGQLTVQLLKSAGCVVIGIDLDPSKVELAAKLGADHTFARSTPNLKDRVIEAADGIGVDAVLITAATSSNDPIELAGEITRDRGRVIAIGAVKMDVPRNLYYEKELSVFLSRSYGPGRYDREYEEEGRDYPINYVRWTENRNMQTFVELIASGNLDIEPIISHVFPIDEANRAYDVLNGKSQEKFLGILLSYDIQRPIERRVVIPSESKSSTKTLAAGSRVRVGVIGAGVYGTSTWLPAAKKVGGLELAALASATGVTAKMVGARFGFDYCTTDTDEVLGDAKIDAVAILTRNSLHAPVTIQALARGKHVFVEKPLAINEEELAEVEEAWRRSTGHLFVGFNRRYSPYGKDVRNFFKDRASPIVATYRVSAESIPANHWIYDEKEGGGRLITEACHFIDFLQFIIGDTPVSVHATPVRPPNGAADPRLRENVAITIGFADGSIGTVLYTNAGDGAFGKEHVEFFCGGSSAMVRDFRELRMSRGGRLTKKKNWLSQEKGHKQELEAFAAKCATPRSAQDDELASAIRTTRVTFAAVRSMMEGKSINLSG